MTALSWQDITCPACKAPPGRKCRNGQRVLAAPHTARIEAAAATPAATPVERVLQLGYAAGDEAPHVVSAADQEVAVCGTPLVHVPVVQPDPVKVHPRCMRLLTTVEGAPAPTLTGICPVCVSEEDLDEQGRIGWHKQMYGLTRSSLDCPGAGELPEATS